MPHWLRLLFGPDAPVGRRAYLVAGLACFAVKYAGDALLVWLHSGRLWTPFDYVGLIATPSFAREPGLSLVAAAIAAWALPFLWIGFSMSARRALDAGSSPWIALLFFVPFLNLALIAVLSCLPSRPRERRTAAWPEKRTSGFARLIAASFLGVAAGVPAFFVSAYGIRDYGYALFLGTPFLMGLVAAYALHRPGPVTLMQTLLAGVLPALIGLSLLLAISLEGLMCIAMAAPLAVGFSLTGAFAGTLLAAQTRSILAPAMLAGVGLPGASVVEAWCTEPVEFETATSVVIDAAPEAVWPNVVAFAELPPPTEWLFRIGIACPVRARIEGQGVGAVRHCEFTTGAFVEPITRWDEPSRLSFDVTEQPDPLRELSPWGAIRPPHLEHGWRSLRGEFRLVRLEDGRTRLEGSTWCQLAYAPTWYWRPQADAIVHTIHLRVLRHVKALSEMD